MQNIFRKFFLLSCFALILSANNLHANIVQERLETADSLFDAKKYTKALDTYQSIWQNYKQYSLQMLLRMAFVSEAEGKYPQALYYLNLYYHYSADEQALDKLSELAAKHELQGYEFSDREYFRSLLAQHFYWVAAGFGLLGLLGVWAIYRRRARGLSTTPLLLGEVALLAGAFVLFNFALRDPQAIIATPHAAVMSAPSAGAEQRPAFKAGDRVRLAEKRDIWYGIFRGDEKAYVRENNLMVVE